MTYSTGGVIQANDYNTFATLVNSVNAVYADIYPGATTLPNAGYGYGQPALTSVTPGNPVLASEWAALFTAAKAVGTHQGTTTVPPLPVTNPVNGDVIAAYAGVDTLIATLNANRFNLAVGQSTYTTGTNQVQPSSTPWGTKLTFTCQVNFGNWNNARYFFNSGGYISFTGSYTPAVAPIDSAWASALNKMSPTLFKYNTTTNANGNNIVTPPGFYGLTTVYAPIYTKTGGGSGYYYYTTDTVTISAKLNAAAGTNGIIDFKIELLDSDPTVNLKTGTTTFQINNLRSTGAVTIAAPTVSGSAFVSTP